MEKLRKNEGRKRGGGRRCSGGKYGDREEKKEATAL